MKITNKRANYEYKLEGDRVEAGISLSGGEAKAIRTGHADINQSVARVVNDEIFLINANIPIPEAQKYSSTRTRKLLLHRDEIVSLTTKMKQFKLTLVPTNLYNKGRLIKVTLALGKPKREFEKKEAIKRKDIERELEKEFKLR
ncbi:SsrA-binding protein [Candidatus Woesebacteria bacterium RBG_19FT_COMBO_42_9]|uniref:SsrA-binding protein n=1 Tax=Candidatus Woesebacteria bacterium RBG_16_42_24 TaxID=1802485 RepID=A0A1F7XN44_9BACT|nr:MAG: SsrA-binding protein [Candidatus Woesebacteria bacterium RBG_16_42_24]OGM16996.1 MAG: SsrA-binding protein [Candidatus Woesebacteria bacterium RBG_19FT_COMBO_42_9]OGM68426.1 MAG: SsrA-binding protein [Candidatus Woesebacteria bacterium RIFCSPLOWO2_01_FULL_43_11]